MDKGCKDEIKTKLEVDQDGKVEVYMTLNLNGVQVRISFSQAREIWEQLTELFEEEEEKEFDPIPTMWPMTIPNPLVEHPNPKPWGPITFHGPEYDNNQTIKMEGSETYAGESKEEGNEMVS